MPTGRHLDQESFDRTGHRFSERRCCCAYSAYRRPAAGREDRGDGLMPKRTLLDLQANSAFNEFHCRLPHSDRTLSTSCCVHELPGRGRGGPPLGHLAPARCNSASTSTCPLQCATTSAKHPSASGRAPASSRRRTVASSPRPAASIRLAAVAVNVDAFAEQSRHRVTVAARGRSDQAKCTATRRIPEAALCFSLVVSAPNQKITHQTISRLLAVVGWAASPDPIGTVLSFGPLRQSRPVFSDPVVEQPEEISHQGSLVAGARSAPG